MGYLRKKTWRKSEIDRDINGSIMSTIIEKIGNVFIGWLRKALN